MKKMNGGITVAEDNLRVKKAVGGVEINHEERIFQRPSVNDRG